jgi:hypothetical protein
MTTNPRRRAAVGKTCGIKTEIKKGLQKSVDLMQPFHYEN